jgi:hypothetical protein
MLSVITGAILAVVAHSHKAMKNEPPSASAVASFFEKNKPLISEFSAGVVGGVVTSGLAKYFVKSTVLIGAGVFVVSSGIVELTIPKIFDGQDQMLKKGADQAANLATEIERSFGKGINNVLNCNGDKVIDKKDFKW